MAFELARELGSGTKQLGGGRLGGGESLWDPQEMRQWGRSAMDETKEVGMGSRERSVGRLLWQV